MVLSNQFSSTALVQALDFLSLLESLFIPQDATLYFHLPIKDSSVSVWLEEWKSGRIKNGERMENILFSFIFVWLGVKKWRDEKNKFE